MSEHLMQAKVVQYVRNFHPEVIICSIPNGSGTTAKNRLQLFAEGLLAGMPDLFIPEPKKGFNGLLLKWKRILEKKAQPKKEAVAVQEVEEETQTPAFVIEKETADSVQKVEDRKSVV